MSVVLNSAITHTVFYQYLKRRVLCCSHRVLGWVKPCVQAILIHVWVSDKLKKSCIGNLTKQRSSCKAYTFCAIEEIARILWGLEVHCRLHMSVRIIPALSQISPHHPNSSSLISI